jgi:hypothetical protein
MPLLVLKNAYVTIAGTSGTVDVSDHVKSLEISSTYDIVETTVFGDVSKRRIASLADNQFSVEFNQDFGSGSIEATIYPLLGTAATVHVRPVNAAISSTNPDYSFQALITNWTPLSANVGELLSVVVQWPISGDITKSIV